ncbi:MAG TPA: metallopeptidase TldD-related protein, partial [Rhodothermales bacterium]|nr:metallopeptidase TldD-related protein [Rhodothermales bacterium]
MLHRHGRLVLGGTEYFRGEADWLRSLALDVLRRAVQGGGWADLFFEHTTQRTTTLRQRAARGQISAPRITAHGRVLSGLGLRRVTTSQVLYAASDHVSPSELERLRSDLRPWEGRPSIAVRQSRGTAIAADDTLIRLAADAALSLSRCIQEVRVELRHTIRRTVVFVSDGATASEVRARRDLRVEVEANIGGGTLRAYALGGTSGDPAHALSLDPERIAAEAVRRALVLSEARPIPCRPMPVVIAAGWGGVWLHEAVGHLLEADLPDSIRLNIGTEAASGAVTIVDDPTLTDARGSYTDDDEATPASRTVLVEDG